MHKNHSYELTDCRTLIDTGVRTTWSTDIGQPTRDFEIIFRKLVVLKLLVTDPRICAPTSNNVPLSFVHALHVAGPR